MFPLWDDPRVKPTACGCNFLVCGYIGTAAPSASSEPGFIQSAARSLHESVDTAFFVTLLLGALVLPAQAQITYTQRTTGYQFSLPDTNDFSGAQTLYANLIFLSAQNIGDYRGNVWTVLPVAQSFFWETFNNQIAIHYRQTGPYQYSGTYTATNGISDVAQISYIAPLGADFSQSFITTGVNNGHYVLNFSGGGGGSLDNGYPYQLVLYLPGDWSVQGTAQGDHNFIALNPEWTIVDDFTYDGIQTIFHAWEPSYHGDNPDLQFQLIGAPVPEPSSLLLLGSGVAGLAGLLRRKRM